MTSCLLVKGPDRLLAVADGRLAVSGIQVSFDQTEKIVRFTPRYQIPQVRMGRFSHYVEYTGSGCFVAYAGTYALVAEVLALFRKRINETLVLVWRDGVATLSHQFNEGGMFGDYDFATSDYPEIGEREVVTEFRDSAQVKISEFCSRRNQAADCEFLVFGKAVGSRGHYAYRVSVDPLWSFGESVRLQVDPVADGALTVIGSAEVAGQAFADSELLSGLEGWRVDQEKIGVTNLFSDMQWLCGADEPPSRSPIPVLPPARNWSLQRLAGRFAQLLRGTADPFVGGELFMAHGGWSGEIELEPL